MLRPGDAFPDFELQDQNGQIVRKADLAGSNAIVYFYPKDDTSGCTLEACDFKERLPKFSGARVIGVSPDSVKSHARFVAKFDLNFTLLADPERALIEKLGLWVEKSLYGKKYMGVVRTTYLIDEAGKVVKVWEKVKPEGHADDVLAALAG